MSREIIRVEPLSTYLERWKAPTSAVTRHGDTIYVSGFPPFDPDTGEVVDAPIERQTELVLEQMKLCVETAGSPLDKILKCNVYCTSVEKFGVVNKIYARYFPEDPRPQVKDFVTKFKAKYGKEPDAFNAFAYDTMVLMGQVMNQFGFEREQIHQGLAKVKDVPSVIFGKATFDPKTRRVDGAVSVDLVVKDGKFTFYEGGAAVR